MDQNKIEQKLDKLDERLDEVVKVLIKQEGNLELHMMRSDNLEKLVQIQEKRITPVEKHVNGIQFFMKALGSLSLIVGLILALRELFSV